MAETTAPANPAGPSPLRRAGSIRRTSTIDTSWPEGLGKPMLMRGRARDALTLQPGTPRILAEDTLEVLASPRREVLGISAGRHQAELQALVGARAGGYLRKEIARVAPDEQARATPLHLLLDDVAGASLVAGWAWSRWTDLWMRPAAASGPSTAGRAGQMEGICAGFRPGSTALRADGTSDPTIQSSASVPPLPHPADPDGWHTLAAQDGVGMRRARRMDVWLEGGQVQIDLGFQDSATSPAGGPDRIAVHEYRVLATADADSLELLSVVADPRVLPYRECPAASPNAAMMVGARLSDMRLEVLERLPGVLGCTHLNDVLRSLADAPNLIGRLREAV